MVPVDSTSYYGYPKMVYLLNSTVWLSWSFRRINTSSLAFVLKDILRAKAIIQQTIELVQEKKSNLSELDYDEKEVNRLERYTTPPATVLTKTHKIPTTERIKDAINK